MRTEGKKKIQKEKAEKLICVWLLLLVLCLQLVEKNLIIRREVWSVGE
jgi:hypothetical protein